MPGTRSFFIICMSVALLLLLALPALGGLFAPRAIPDDAAQGFHLWQASDCAGCHTLNGQGGGYAPDLTRVYSLRGERVLRDFLLNPTIFIPDSNHTMPHAAFTDEEVPPLLAFLKWTDENTGDFRHHPVGEIGEFLPTPGVDTGVVPDSPP
jgi:nitric oxide reductase subunit C